MVVQALTLHPIPAVTLSETLQKCGYCGFDRHFFNLYIEFVQPKLALNKAPTINKMLVTQTEVNDPPAWVFPRYTGITVNLLKEFKAVDGVQ